MTVAVPSAPAGAALPKAAQLCSSDFMCRILVAEALEKHLAALKETVRHSEAAEASGTRTLQEAKLRN